MVNTARLLEIVADYSDTILIHYTNAYRKF